jgi:competence ComEA-like helix-hairpin-helix protein
MALGLSGREQWTLIGVVGVILAGVVAQGLRQPHPGGDVSVDSTGQWEKVVAFQAGQTPPPLIANATTSLTSRTGLTGQTSRTGRTTPTPTPLVGGLDLNRASEAELDRLPGIGPVRARDILAQRGRMGGFRKVDDLLEVRGIGPATLERVRPYVFVSPLAGDTATSLTSPTSPTSTAGGGLNPNPATARPAATPVPPRPALTPELPHLININTAGYEELQKITGVGPVLARRIIDDRQLRGPYRSPSDLERVQGIGPVTVRGMMREITVRN